MMHSLDKLSFYMIIDTWLKELSEMIFKRELVFFIIS